MNAEPEKTGDAHMAGRYRNYTRKTSRNRTSPWNTPSSRNFGSCSSLSSYGSSQELIDLQEDAKSHRIFTEIMRQGLYGNVVSAGLSRRRSMSVLDQDNENRAVPLRCVQSLPTTPVYSQNSTPLQSPSPCRKAARTSRRSFFPPQDSRGIACILSEPSEDLDLNYDDPLYKVELHIEEDFDRQGSESHLTTSVESKPDLSHSETKEQPLERAATPTSASLNPKGREKSPKSAYKVMKSKIPHSLMQGLRKRCRGIITRDMLSTD